MEWFANYAKKKLKALYKTVLEKRGILVYCTLTHYFLTAYMKGTHLSVEAYFPNKDKEGQERKLFQQEPNPIDIFAYEEKILNELVMKPILHHLQR